MEEERNDGGAIEYREGRKSMKSKKYAKPQLKMSLCGWHTRDYFQEYFCFEGRFAYIIASAQGAALHQLVY